MKIRSAIALALGCALPGFTSGCASNANHIGPLPTVIRPVASAASRVIKKKQRVRFVIRLPHKKHHGRLPKYLSPATKSMTVSISLRGKTLLSKTIGLTVGSTGCTGTGVSAQCAFEVKLSPAKGYVASFTTYDGLNGSGNVLSLAQNMGFNVVRGQSTVVGLTMDGVPKSVLIFADGRDAFYADVLDADRNMILGDGAPTIRASGAGPTVVTITQPPAAAPNTITLVPTSGKAGIETIGLAASYAPGTTNGCAEAGAVCSFPDVATATSEQELFLTNYYDVASSSVLGFSVPFTSAKQLPNITIAMSYPFAPVLDDSDNLFIPQYGNPGSLYEYAPPYNTVTASSSGLANSQGIAIASGGDVFVTGTNLYEYTPPYTAAPTTFAGLSNSQSIAVDSSDHLYVGSGSTLQVFAPPYTSASTPEYSVALASASSYPIVTSGNKLYVGEANNVQVFNLPITGNNPAAAATISDGVYYAYDLAFDASGNLYVANFRGGGVPYGNGSITVYDAPITNGEAAAATIPIVYFPCGVAFDAAGNLYVSTDEGGAANQGSIQEFTPPFTSSSTPAVTVSAGIYRPDGPGLAIAKSTRFSLQLNE